MTKQTILTQKEAEAIEWVKQQIQYKNHPSVFIEQHIKHGDWLGEAKVLTGMHPDTLIRALYVGYEIEQPKFEAGEWVTREGSYNNVTSTALIDTNRRNGRTFKIVSKVDIETVDDSDGIQHNIGNIRYATKEEIFWAELGREVGEFKAGDVTVTINDSPYLLENKDALAEKDEYINGRLKGFYPAESFIKIPQL